MQKKSYKINPFLLHYGPMVSVMQLGSKTGCSPIHSTQTSHYQAYFGRKPSLATLQLFGCKAYAHTLKIDQLKFTECTIECIHVGFAEEKRAYLLYSQDKRQLFEGVEGWEQVMVDSDSDNEGIIDSTSTRDGDPEGGHTDRTVNNEFANAPSTSVKDMDHQEVHMTSPSTTEHPSVPQPLHCSAHSNKGIPPMHPDEDPKLSQGSRSSAKRTLTLAVQDPVGISVGMDKDDTQNAKPLLNVVDDDIGTLHLTADTPQLYKEVMRHNDANDWVVAIMEEYQNLHQKGVFVEVKVPPDACIHEGHLVFTEKVRSAGQITKDKP